MICASCGADNDATRPLCIECGAPLAAASGFAPPRLRLTDLTDCGGCAAKLGADVLAGVLAGLGAISGAAPVDLIAGLDPPDDAAVYRLTDELAVIGTVDFFPPLVDDARTYGAIAAANACSDVFAMGGRVLFALSVAAFPEALDPAAMAAIVEGAAGVVREAGGMLAGGHTIRDPEPKFGLAVIGLVHPDRLLAQGWRAARRRASAHQGVGNGDARLGCPSGPDRTRRPSCCHRLDAHAEPCCGRRARRPQDSRRHGRHRLRAPWARAGDGTRVGDAARLRGGGTAGAAGRAHAGGRRPGDGRCRPQPPVRGPALVVAPGVDGARVALAHDPQTSGGLLAAIAPDRVASVEQAFSAAGVASWCVGRVEASAEPGVALA